MPVKIRLSRCGKTHAPMYKIVAIDSRNPRDGKFLEDIGTYDPLKGTLVRFEKERYDRWLSVGAVPTHTAQRLYRLNSKKSSSIKA